MMKYSFEIGKIRIDAINTLTSYVKDHGDLITKDYRVSMNPGLNQLAISSIPYEIGSTRLLEDIDTDLICLLADKSQLP